MAIARPEIAHIGAGNVSMPTATLAFSTHQRRRVGAQDLIGNAVVDCNREGNATWYEAAGCEATDKPLIASLGGPAILAPDAKPLVARKAGGKRRFVDAGEIGRDRFGKALGTGSMHPL